MTSRHPIDLYVEVDPQQDEGQARARIVARLQTPDGVTQIERALFSEVVYDYPDEGRGAASNIMLLFCEHVMRALQV